MLYNNRIVDLISYPLSEGEMPKDGWQKYRAVVLQLGSKFFFCLRGKGLFLNKKTYIYLKYLDSKQDLTKKSADLINDYYKEAGNSHEGK
jgi:hypothetical protein